MAKDLKYALLELKRCLLEGDEEGLYELSGRLLPQDEGFPLLELEETLRVLRECEELILLQMEETKKALEELRGQEKGLLRYNENKALGP